MELIPPKDLYTPEKKKLYDLNVTKARVARKKDLSNFLLVLVLNNPITNTELVKEMAKCCDPNFYYIKSSRHLKLLIGYGLIESKAVYEINFEEPNEIEKKIISKLKFLPNMSKKIYNSLRFYYPTQDCLEILPFIAKKNGWEINNG